MIARREYLRRIRAALARSPVVMLVGPRQCGKTTLAREVAVEPVATFFDMEEPAVAALMEQPMTALAGLRGLVVLDEAQREPGLFPVLRVLVDRPGNEARFLVLGSASPALSRQASESLAGRVEVIEVRGFSSAEVADRAGRGLAELWLRGGFPRSFLADSDEDSTIWRENFIRTFLERDLAMLGFGMSPRAMARFWTMLSHYHAQIWNASEVASSLSVSSPTARSYLDALEQTFMVRRLSPWHANVGKRLVKSPKIYLRDSGLFHTLQGIGTSRELSTHPKLGASWEGFALEEVLAVYRPREAWFYAIHSSAELDIFFLHRGARIGVELKRADAPRITRSMRVVIEDLELDRLMVVYPGERRYALAENIECVPLEEVRSLET